MARIPFTLRIDAEERTALEHLSGLDGRPMNQLLNEAIKSYLSQQSPIAVLQLLYTESTRSSGFFLKKKPPCTLLNSARVLENRSKEASLEANLSALRK
jgi:hypothetical protein